MWYIPKPWKTNISFAFEGTKPNNLTTREINMKTSRYSHLVQHENIIIQRHNQIPLHITA